MKTVINRSRRSQRGVIRTAVLLSVCFGTCLLVLSRHPLYAATGSSVLKTAVGQTQIGKDKDGGSSEGTGAASYAYGSNRKQLRLIDATDKSIFGSDTSSSVNSPPSPSLYAVVMAPNQQLPLATTSPLPLGDRLFGDDRPGGFWTADYGKISPDGKRYTAPAIVPPVNGIDVVEYTSVGVTSALIPTTLTVTIVVRDPKKTGGDNVFPFTGTMPLPLVKIEQDAQAKGLTGKENMQTAVWLGQVNQNLSRNVESVMSKPVMGYLLPSWSDYGGVQVYAPSIDPATSVPLAAPKVSRRGPLSGPPTQSASNYDSNYQLDTFTAPPKSVANGSTGWTTVGTLKLTLSDDNITKIDLDYKAVGGSASFGLKSGAEWSGNLRSMSNRYIMLYYIDHWRVSVVTQKHSKKSWIWKSEDEQYENGIGNIYDPAWYSVIAGYPANGAPIWTPLWLTKTLGMP